MPIIGRRGQLVTIVMQGDFGKPRPALIIQANQFDLHTTIAVLPVTSTLVPVPLFRVTIEPSSSNGLQQVSQIMVDKPLTCRREKIATLIGEVDKTIMIAVERCLAIFLGIAK